MEQKIDRLLASMPPPPSYDPDDTRYTLVLHGLCKRYSIKEPLERHVFSIVENMSRSGPCLYKLEKFVEYAGGTPKEIEAVLISLERRNCIVKGKLKQTNGWKLTDEARRVAKSLKANLGHTGKDY